MWRGSSPPDDDTDDDEHADAAGPAASAASAAAEKTPTAADLRPRKSQFQSRQEEAPAAARTAQTADAVVEDINVDADAELLPPAATALQDLIAGGIAGSVSVIVGHPFDTYKVRLQTSPASSSTSTSTSSSGSGSGGGKKSSPPNANAKVNAASSKQFGGMSSLFRGMTAPLATAAVVNAMIFSSFGESSRYWDEYMEGGEEEPTIQQQQQQQQLQQQGNDQSKLHAHDHDHNYAKDNVHMHTEGHLTHTDDGSVSSSSNLKKSLVCGSFAGFVQCVVICPMEHIKCRLQVQHGKGAADNLFKGPLDAVSKIFKGYGIRGLYRGWWVTTVREVPAFGLYFATYDDIKDRINRLFEEQSAAGSNSNNGDDGNGGDGDGEQLYVPHHSHTWAASAIAGGVSGSFTWAIIYPVDVIKSRIQTSALDCADPSKLSMWNVGREIVRENGWRFMFRGLGVTLCRAFPVNGIIFPVYEFTLMKLTEAGIGGSGGNGNGARS